MHGMCAGMMHGLMHGMGAGMMHGMGASVFVSRVWFCLCLYLRLCGFVCLCLCVSVIVYECLCVECMFVCGWFVLVCV